MIKQLRYDLGSSMACLTSTPSQFVSLDSLQAGIEAKKLKDKLDDIIDIVVYRSNNNP